MILVTLAVALLFWGRDYLVLRIGPPVRIPRRVWLYSAVVFMMAVLVGFVVKTVDLYVTSLGKTPLAVALLGSGMYGLFQLQVTSAFTAFLSGGLAFVPLLVLAAEGLVNDLSRGQAQWQR